MFVDKLSCPRCSQTYSSEQVNHLCKCGTPLLVDLDISEISNALSKNELLLRPANLWRYAEFLPVKDKKYIVSLGEGFTPITPLEKIESYFNLKHLYLKNEGFSPTGTFKDRGASVGVSKAKELGVSEIALTSAGNAGGAWASYSAVAEIKAYVAIPDDTPDINIKECVAAGAQVYLVKGLISDAGKFIEKGISRYGWYNASTLKEPYRIEGKKTMGLELAEQFNWELPDVIVYPCGGGVGLIGMWKAFSELIELGWISPRMPRMIAVQAEGCAPVVKAYKENKEEMEFFTGASTQASGLRVPKPLGDFLIMDAIYKSNGAAVAVPEQEIIDTRVRFNKIMGLNICLEGATGIAALPLLKEKGLIADNERVVIFNTGTGLKSPDLPVEYQLPIYQPEDEI